MRLRTANNRRKRKLRRMNMWQVREFLFNIYKDDPQCDDGRPRTVTCKVCGVDKPFFKVNPSGVCSDCD